MKDIQMILIISAGLFCNSCQKEVVIDVPKAQDDRLLIECILEPGVAPRVFVSESRAFFSADVSPQELFARGAIVKMNASDISTPIEFSADSVFNRFRCRWEPFYTGGILPKYGDSYSLAIEHQGKHYSASTTIEQVTPTIQSVVYTPEFFDVYGGHDGVIISINADAGSDNFYRFRMDRMIDNSVFHAHALDGLVNNCTSPEELFPVTDHGRTIFEDRSVGEERIEMMIEVTYEYQMGDRGQIYIQSLDPKSAFFYRELDEQLQSIRNPFVEPVFLQSRIGDAIGVFGSAVHSEPVWFAYPQDNP